jgi:hypothetical protein
MKKTAILFLSLVSVVAVNAQGLPLIEPILEIQDAPGKRVYRSAQIESSSSTTVWSEDFANGIPAGWSQNGTPATAQWEYRGPNTTPDNTNGSRGNYSGVATGANDPIFSTTGSNGFVIFDSDYLDNAGTSTFGAGVAAAPHTGRLITDTIDCSTFPALELKMEIYARRFFSEWKVAFSIDGGVTYTDTIEFFNDVVVPTNGSTGNGDLGLANVSSIIGGQANVVMQFLFDGTLGNANGSGYYYWMLDDIELRTPPANEMFFTTWNGAPAQDMIYNGDGAGYPKYGTMHTTQIVPVEFDANFYNYGTNTQTNAKLEVEVWDITSGTPNLISTLTTTGCPTLAAGDTCNFNSLTTPQWTPPATAAEYLLVYKAVSDTITSAITTSADTFAFNVSDTEYSLDRGVQSGFVGTNSANPEIIAMGAMYDLVNETPSPSPGSGLVYINALNLGLSAATDSTADIEVAFYDTAGFAFNAGFPATATAAFRRSFTLNSTMPGTIASFDLTNSNGEALALPAQPYLMIINFFPNATDGVIRIANDASFDQPSISSVMQLADGNWFGGFTSDAHEGTWLRLQLPDFYAISLVESELAEFSVYPNPTKGEGSIEFTEGGAYAISVTDMVGNTILSMEETVNANEKIRFDLSSYASGVYLININGEGGSKTVKVTVQ